MYAKVTETLIPFNNEDYVAEAGYATARFEYEKAKYITVQQIETTQFMKISTNAKFKTRRMNMKMLTSKLSVACSWKDCLVDIECFEDEHGKQDPRIALVLLTSYLRPNQQFAQLTRINIPADGALYKYAKTMWNNAQGDDKNMLGWAINDFLKMIDHEDWGMVDVLPEAEGQESELHDAEDNEDDAEEQSDD